MCTITGIIYYDCKIAQLTVHTDVVKPKHNKIAFTKSESSSHAQIPKSAQKFISVIIHWIKSAANFTLQFACNTFTKY